jgi:Spy/CpxP family protein refolding chaperone
VNRVAVITSLIAVFLTGVSLGLVGSIAFTGQHSFGAPGHDGPPRPGGRGRGSIARMLPRLAKDLDLTPEQIKRIEPKITASQHEFETARESLRSRIESELSPEQRIRWRELVRERERARGRDTTGAPRGGDDVAHPAPPPGAEGERK